jgi:nitrogen regulatory protein P-II 2
MQTTQLSLVTVVAEAVLETRLVELVRSLGATGYTLSDCRGEGSRGLRSGLEAGNVRLEVVVSAEVADALVTRLAESWFRSYAVIAWVSAVSVVRGEKYLG